MDSNQQSGEAAAPASGAAGNGNRGALAGSPAFERATLEGFMQELASPDEALYAGAAEAILTLDSRSTAPLLRRLLQQGHMPGSARAAELLGRLGDRDSLDLLTEVAGSRSHPAAGAAHTALCKIADPRSVPYFCARLTEPDVLEALELLRDPRSIPVLTAALQRGAAPVDKRVVMVRILQRLGGPAAMKALAQGSTEEPEQLRDARLDALGDLLPQAAAAVVEELGQPGGRGEFAFAAAERLGRAALPSLVEAAAAIQPARQMRIALLLGDLGGEEACRTLAGLASTGNASVRREAARSLGRLGDRAAIRALEPLLADRNPGVRTAAAISLGRMGRIDSDLAGPLITGLEFSAMRADAVEILELMAYRAPGEHLRTAVRPLRVLSRPWSRIPAELRQQCRALIEQIEQQTSIADETESEGQAEETLHREALQV